MRGKKRLYSLPKSPVLRPIRNPSSVKLCIDNKINEQLFSFSRQANFNYISIHYKRLKQWLKKGISFHPKNFIEISRILYPNKQNNTKTK
jgi:hypothetical protein